MEGMYLGDSTELPEKFIRGLTAINFQGRGQVMPDPHCNMQRHRNSNFGQLIFYLDGAHTPESMEMCAKWFSHAIMEDSQNNSSLNGQSVDNSNVKQILLFNCMSVRDHWLLLSHSVNACADNGVHFHNAIFVPTQFWVVNKAGSHATPTDSPPFELSWQLTIQRARENLVGEGKDSLGEGTRNGHLNGTMDCRMSLVFASLPLAVKWLRDNTKQNPSIHLQVLVTGSLHLVGDVMRLIRM